MHSTTETEGRAPHHADPATGAGLQATTPVPVLLARVAFFDAQRALHEADAHVQQALQGVYEADPAVPAAERRVLAESARFLAEYSLQQADAAAARAAELRAQLPPAPAAECMAVAVVTIQRDRIQLTAKLHMGGTQSVTRGWERLETGGWRSRSPEFVEAQDRLGLEFAEWMDGIDLPGRVASMLPRPPAPSSTAAADAAREVGHG